MSKRFLAPLFTFGWVSPLKSGGSIVVNALLLPVVIQFFARYFTPQQVNLSIVQWSLFLATIGTVVIGLPVAAHPTLIVVDKNFNISLNFYNFCLWLGLLLQTLASGLDPSLQSLAASFVRRGNRGDGAGMIDA